MDIQDSLSLASSHLSGYLCALRDSSDIHVRVKSRWPWAVESIVPYPNSFLDRLVLFIKTLHFCIPKEVKDQFLMRSIQSLSIYKSAIRYQLLAHKPKYLSQEKEILSGKSFLGDLEKFEDVLLRKEEIPSDLKGSLREWGGCLVDLHADIRLDAILDFKKSSDRLLESVQNIKKNVQQRVRDLPSLMENAINKQMEFFAQESLVEKQHRIGLSLPKRVQLFSYFVSEKPCQKRLVCTNK